MYGHGAEENNSILVCSLWSLCTAVLYTYWVIALEWWEAVDARQRSGVPDPLNSLPVGYQPDILHVDNGVKECNKSFFVMWLCEPGSMIEQAKWCSVEYVNSVSNSLPMFSTKPRRVRCTGL
jgi:hypothetical protein